MVRKLRVDQDDGDRGDKRIPGRGFSSSPGQCAASVVLRSGSSTKVNEAHELHPGIGDGDRS